MFSFGDDVVFPRGYGSVGVRGVIVGHFIVRPRAEGECLLHAPRQMQDWLCQHWRSTVSFDVADVATAFQLADAFDLYAAHSCKNVNTDMGLRRALGSELYCWADDICEGTQPYRPFRERHVLHEV